MLFKHHLLLGFLCRIVLVLYSHWQDAWCTVRYTDIDYQVFLDASQHLGEGASPFARPTYRYTPIIAILMLPSVILHVACGKILFCLLDIAASALMATVQRQAGYPPSICRLCSFLWLYNPFVMVISTRGSAESILAVLIPLAIYLQQVKKPCAAGLIYGLSIHFKLYPCIYFLTFYFAFSSKGSSLLWINRAKLSFVVSMALGFLLPTILSAALYEDYLSEAFFYHLKRKDIRHNFSPLFYVLYLSESPSSSYLSLLSPIPFVLQAGLIALVSWRLPQSLPVAMLVETMLFVAFNKVCTSQYFLWYLSLFPLCFPLLRRQCVRALVAWVSGQIVWLAFAYYLEFKGLNTFIFIHLSSLIFFVSNIYCISFFLKCVPYPLRLKEEKQVS